MIDIQIALHAGKFQLDVATTLPDQGIIGLVGPNGAGKSTLLNAMAGVAEYEGAIFYGQRELRSLSRTERVKTISYVAQTHGTLPDLTVRQLVEMGQSAGRGPFWKPEPANSELLEEAIVHSGLSDMQDRPLRTLSGGQIQRAMTARALAQDASHVLLDEPTNHLDLHHQYNLMEMLRHVATSHATTVIIALHDLALASRYCDTVLVLDNGRPAAQGEPKSVLTSNLLRSTFGVDADLVDVQGYPSLIVRGPNAES